MANATVPASGAARISSRTRPDSGGLGRPRGLSGALASRAEMPAAAEKGRGNARLPIYLDPGS